MGLFDIFRKKKPVWEIEHTVVDNPVQNPKTDLDQYLIIELRKKIEALGYEVEWSTEYRAMIVSSEVEIATAIINSPENHHTVIHLMISVSHKLYFPDGIIENIAAAGYTDEEKVEAVLKNFLVTTFPAIMEGFTDTHQPEFDFNDEEGVLWHPKVGDLVSQGIWENSPERRVLYDLLSEKLKCLMEDKKFNWLKVYAARMPDNSIIAECILNNKQWAEGARDLYAYAEKWGQSGVFLTQKQFMIIRRCDKFDKELIPTGSPN